MAKDYVKRGGVVQPVYDGKKLQSGLTVQGTAYEPDGSGGFQQTGYAGVNPIAFTEIGATGRYTAQITATSVDGWHLVMIDSTTQSMPGIYKFRVEDNAIQEIYDLASALDAKVDDIQGAGFVSADDSLEALSVRQVAIQGATFATGTDSLEAIRNAVDSIQSSVDGIEGSVSSTITLESEPDLEIPAAGVKRYRLTVRNYGGAGMKDFDALPTVAVDAEGTDITATRLYDARTAGSLSSTMALVGSAGSGTYEIFFEVDNADTPSSLNFVVSAVEDAVGKTFHKAGARVEAGTSGSAQESTLTDMKETTTGTFDRDTDSMEAIRNRVDSLHAATQGGGFNSSTDSLEALRDNQELFKTKAGGTFDQELHSLEALRLEIDDAITFSGLGAH